MRSRRRLLLLGALVVLSVTTWGWWSGARSVRETRRVVERLEARRAELERRNRDLVRQIEALRRDGGARERAAREFLGVASPEETIVVLPTPTALPSPPAQAPSPPAGRRPGQV